MPEAERRTPRPGETPFLTTRWSLVLEAGRRTEPGASRALEELCGAYWFPLYAYVRRRGHRPDDAEDLTQAFFARLLEKNDFAGADPERGKFRAFLLASLKHFLANEWDRARAEKRGGGRRILSIDFADADRRFEREPAHAATPEKAFERTWALAVLDGALARLEQDYRARGRGELFARLRGHLLADAGRIPLRELAAELETTEGALKVAAHRLRQAFRQSLRREIAETVHGERALEEELRELLAALGA